MSKVVAVPLSQDMTNCCVSKFDEKLNCSGTTRPGRGKKQMGEECSNLNDSNHI